MTARALCQRDGASCGSCCGVYNRADHGREAIARTLDRRTARLAGAERTPEAYRAAAAALARDEPAPLFPSVRACPLLGWLDAARTRVGCLGHPALTGGLDLRDCGAYDARVCESFRCPSHASLAEEEAALTAELLRDDPFLYGLVVTDVPFLRAALEAVATLTGAAVTRRDLQRPRFRRALAHLVALKEELAPGSEGLFGAFGSDGDAGPVPHDIDRGALARDTSPHEALLTCVGADARSGNDLDRLEAEVRLRLDRCAAARDGR